MERSECLKMACQLQKWRRGEGAKEAKKQLLPLVVTIIVSKEATENAAILNTISKVGCQRTGTPP